MIYYQDAFFIKNLPRINVLLRHQIWQNVLFRVSCMPVLVHESTLGGGMAMRLAWSAWLQSSKRGSA